MTLEKAIAIPPLLRQVPLLASIVKFSEPRPAWPMLTMLAVEQLALLLRDP